ncbi:MAG: hypothetical protein F6J87_15955 [Spirulina sp. SIO3F2]|nr:hypothetical protein [Spirulina sp. SIO3F2]
MSSAERAYQSGGQAFKQKQYDQAITYFQRCSALCKQNGQPGSKLAAQACIGLIKCYRAKGQTENAIALCRKLAKSANPQLNAWAHQTLTALGVAEAHSDSAKTLYQSGIQAFKNKQYAQAIEYLQQLDQWCQEHSDARSPLQAKAQMGLVKCYRATQQLEPAIALCEHLATISHPTIQPWATHTLDELTAQLNTTEPLSELGASEPEPDSEQSAFPEPKPTPAEPTPEDPKLLEAGLKANRKARHAEAIELLTDYLRCQPSETSRNFLQAQMALVKAYIATEQVEAAIARCRELNSCTNSALKTWANKTLVGLLPPEELSVDEPEIKQPEPEALLESEGASGSADEMVTSQYQRQSSRAAKARKPLTRPTKSTNGFSKEEILSLVGTFFLVLVLSWLASGSIAVLGIWGILLFTLAIIKGASWAAPSSNIVRPAVGVILFAIYIISPIFGRLLIYAFGMLIGYFGFRSFRAACRRSNAVNLTDPQPLRMIGAILAGILLAIMPAFIWINSVSDQLADGEGLVMIASATPLHQAVGYKDVGAVQALLLAGSDVNAIDDFGQTPLHWAVSGCISVALDLPGLSEEANIAWECQPTNIDREITKILLDGGGNPNPGFDQSGSTLMSLAYERDDPEMVALLQQYGAQ